MKYIGYSELTKKFYLLPTSKKAVKIDITEDIQEIVNFYKQTESPDSEAVEFAEWASERYAYVEKNKWDGDNDETFTTTQLYQLFKSQP